MEVGKAGRRMGHEFVGVIEDVGSDVETLKVGEHVISLFKWSEGTCLFCAAAAARSAFLRIERREGKSRSPAAFATVKSLTVRTQPGTGDSSPVEGRARHCLTAKHSSRTPRASKTTLTHVAGSRA